MLRLIELFTHSEELHKTLRTGLIAVAVIVVARGLFGSFTPQPLPNASPIAAPVTPHPIAREAQAAVDASKTLAQVNGGQVPAYAKPVVRIMHDCFGFSPSQCYAILSATAPKTAPVMRISANLSGRSPEPTPTPGVFSKEQIETMFAVAKSADATAIAQSHITVNAHLDYAEVPTSRLSALLSPSGSGAGYDLIRRKRFALIGGAIERGSHVSPVLGLHWEVPHTSLSCGPIVFYDRATHVQISCGSHF